MILVLYWTNDIQWFLVLFHIISLSLLWQHAPLSVVKTIPSLAWNSSHLTVRHLTGIQEICDTRHLRNILMLANPKNKPSPGPHGPQVYHIKCVEQNHPQSWYVYAIGSSNTEQHCHSHRQPIPCRMPGSKHGVRRVVHTRLPWDAWHPMPMTNMNMIEYVHQDTHILYRS